MTTVDEFDPQKILDLLSLHLVSQNKLAIYSGYSRSYVARCLSGEQNPSEQFIKDINRAIKELTGSRSFNYKEMEIIKSFLTPERGANEFNMKSVATENSMTDREWQQFLEKLK